jgi:nitrite reductase/ring-hydroxylating ferredoxin subunit
VTDAWRKLRGATGDGAAVCALADVPDPGTMCLSLGWFPVLVARSGDLLRVYVNACPHQHLPLDYRGGRVISADGRVLRCTNHQAGFRLGDGAGIEGFGIGLALERIPAHVDPAGIVVVGAGG